VPKAAFLASRVGVFAGQPQSAIVMGTSPSPTCVRGPGLPPSSRSTRGGHPVGSSSQAWSLAERFAARLVRSVRAHSRIDRGRYSKERAPGAGVAVGGGIAIGAALGMLIGLLLSAELWLMVGVGVVAGLLIGAIVDLQRAR
ncbi:MAG TPA: hypothetical protein VIK13_12150, partial [Candidatus Limnocylindrales bacterium]